MSDRPEGSAHGEPVSAERVQAGVRQGWWPGWIWAIPVAALLIVI
jgi:hypothetical protein